MQILRDLDYPDMAGLTPEEIYDMAYDEGYEDGYNNGHYDSERGYPFDVEADFEESDDE